MYKFINNQFWLVLGFCLALVGSAEGADPRQYAVEITATVQTSPAQIRLDWTTGGSASSYTVFRKSGSSWSQVASLGASATTWTDSSVSVGLPYEYKVQRNGSPTGTGYIYAGIRVPMVDSRGKVVLVVDNTYASQLVAELARLQQDLVGDGWTVIRHDVSPTTSAPSVKNLIKSAYQADPANVKAVLLFGHVAVPYSGSMYPDAHSDHYGAWPADGYYGDMDGNWTDNSVNNTSSPRAETRNVPGDGKFDQTYFPSEVELQVGRVDLSRMTCFSNKTPSRSELDLLRNYLNKHNNFRHNRLNIPRRGIITDNFGDIYGESFASSGWRNFGSMMGGANSTAIGGNTYFSAVNSQAYLWTYGCGGGSYYTCGGIGSSDNFATTEIKTVFTMFFGSYFGDWDNESAFLRAPLGSGYALTAAWAGRPHWFFHHMGLGETIGVGTRLTQNNNGGYTPQGDSSRMVHIALMGDPTLRLHPVTPPSNLAVSISGSTATLNWGASTDSNIQGYHVYRGSSANGPFIRLTSSPITSLSYTDNSSGTYTYMVRAIKLETSPSGTYFNPSQGIFVNSIGGSGVGGGTAPVAPNNLVATAQSVSQINLSWSDLSNNETGFAIERKTGVTGTYALLATTGASQASFSNTGLAAGTRYYYRIRSFNSTGYSAYSAETSATTQTASGGGGTVSGTTAQFVNIDSATSGNWKGKYGADGHNILLYRDASPGFVVTTPSGKTNWWWAESTTQASALQKPDANDRWAATWYSGSLFNVNLRFTDTKLHRVAFYVMDWGNSGRAQRIQVLDAVTGALLQEQTVSNFQNGKYVVFDLSGNVTVRFTRLSGDNAVLEGIFFDGAAGGISSSTTIAKISGGYNLTIKGVVGETYVIQTSSNLATWTPISTNTLNSTTFNFTDPNASAKSKFYRAIKR